MNRRELLKIASVGSVSLFHPALFAQVRGGFSGRPETRGLVYPNQQLLRDFSFRDANGRIWLVPKGYVTDGASIPRILYTPAGGPWSGPYADAAIIHDYYCDVMSRSWEATHYVFKEGMLARGVSAIEAETKHGMVYMCGPRWNATHRWDGVLRLNFRTRRQFVLEQQENQIRRLAEADANGRYEIWQRSIQDDLKTAVENAGAEAFSIENYEPPTTFDYDAALAEAEQRIEEFGVTNDKGQLLMPADQLSPYSLEGIASQPDPAIIENSNSIRQIQNMQMSGPG